MDADGLVMNSKSFRPCEPWYKRCCHDRLSISYTPKRVTMIFPVGCSLSNSNSGRPFSQFSSISCSVYSASKFRRHVYNITLYLYIFAGFIIFGSNRSFSKDYVPRAVRQDKTHFSQIFI